MQYVSWGSAFGRSDVEKLCSSLCILRVRLWTLNNSLRWCSTQWVPSDLLNESHPSAVGDKHLYIYIYKATLPTLLVEVNTHKLGRRGFTYWPSCPPASLTITCIVHLTSRRSLPIARLQVVGWTLFAICLTPFVHWHSERGA